MVTCYVPSADQYPRRGDGHKGASSAPRCDGASVTLAPVTTTSTPARTKGTGQEQSRSRQMKDKKCPLALYRADTHGLHG